MEKVKTYRKHIVSAVIVACFLMGVCAQNAYADVIWLEKDYELNSFMGIVLGHPYTDEGRYSAICEITGFSWDDFSSQVKQAIMDDDIIRPYAYGDEGEFLNLAYNVIPEEIRAIIEFALEAVSTIFGMPDNYVFVWDADQYDTLRNRIAYHAWARVDSGSNVGDDSLIIKLRTEYPDGYNQNDTIYVLQNRYLSYGGKNYYLAGDTELDTVRAQYPNSQQLQNGVGMPEYGELVIPLDKIKGNLQNKIQDYDWYYTAIFDTSKKPNGILTILPKGNYDVSLVKSAGTFGNRLAVKYTVDEGYEGYNVAYGSGFSVYVDSITDTYKFSVEYSMSNVSKTFTGEYTTTYEYGRVVTNNVKYVPTPDPPREQPEQPDVPDDTPPSADDPISWPSLTWPQIDFPDIVIETPAPQYTGTDYTSWLKQIDDDIRFYGSETVTLLDDIYTQLGLALDDIVESLTNISEYLACIGNDLGTHCDHITNEIFDGFVGLKTYLGGQYRWIVACVEDIGEDITDGVNYWLKRIYARLQGLTVTQPSIDTDEGGFFDWLGDLWDGFLKELLSIAPGLIGGLVEDIGGLAEKFPFSLPWDIAFLLGLFVRDPIVPVYDFEINFAFMSEPVVLGFDMTEWDGVATILRTAELLAFDAGLIFWTLKNGNPINGIKGGKE